MPKAIQAISNGVIFDLHFNHPGTSGLDPPGWPGYETDYRGLQ